MCFKTWSCISDFSFQPLLICLYGASLPCIIISSPPLPHLLVLALVRAEILQHPAVPHIWEFLPQSALSRCGHRAAPRSSITSPEPVSRATTEVVHSIVRTSFADVTANCLAPDLLCNDRSPVRLVERFWNREKSQTFSWLLHIFININHSASQWTCIISYQ